MENIAEQPEEKIVVYASYDTVVAANLAKTKLDAYGIPCFLSDENFVGLYPIRNELFPGVRLHIFEKDFDQVKDILEDQTLPAKDELLCPDCKKGTLYIDKSQKDNLIKTALLLIGILMPNRNVYRCPECGKEYDTPPESIKSSTL